MTDFAPDSVTFSTGHYIGGEVFQAGERIDVARPSDGATYADLPIADADIVDRAVTNATKAVAASGWATQPPRERARALRRWADLIEDRAVELGRLEAVGSTRPIAQAVTGDVASVAEGIRFFSEWADKLGGEVAATRQDHLGLIVSEPYGVVGAITPWNFPLSMASWKVGPALAAGNAIVLKPSELTPFSTARLAELAVEAGIPAGIFNVVQGNGVVTGDALSRHPGIAKLSFTGSTRTGIAVMKAAAESGIKPVTLELGGKSPQLVFADADLDKAAACIAGSLLANAGQACVAGSRLIVQRSVMDELVARLQARLAIVAPGPTWKAATAYAPIISETQARRIDDILARSRVQGAECLLGGARIEGFGGAFYQPTLLAGVTAQTAAVREEIFGPVLTIQAFDDEAEGLSLADHPEYGLAAGVYTADLGRGLRAMRALKAGTVWINRYSRTLDFILPTGGYKSSGIGKDLGRQAVEANLRHKTVLIDIGG
ncbi:MAG TPA: aldehyde dehydrogenase family protein [Bosea sp. (in: a-proteobacteria)]|jgi:aldehyde dehydrogenase (NAD+)|uniref:aldehyde dehydrogenase family protein n=1 Tax=Bosea sp. (in: a-proteobacteria) TaxID=1871050 RepID=UPI002DDD6B7D|nr:aldehyde dehydrogenase family protein [Bosea sp. (in: a-proteobacteria)]HEV2554910.1 aldehyde dehydrogenase family protein [Bosea sp. (in: a-proteobacteria)]